MVSNYDDVRAFHDKFGLLHGQQPRQLTPEKLKERLEFLWEEFYEFMGGCGVCIWVCEMTGKLEIKFEPRGKPDIAEQADALIDLVYVAMGTAVMMGLPWQELWDDVQRANMAKVRGVSHRGHPVDCVKPEGWIGPRTMEILMAHGYDPEAKEVGDEV